MHLKEALAELRKAEKRKFSQTVDLIINLKGIDPKKDSVNVIAQIPHTIKQKKVCGFLENKNEQIRTVTRIEFDKYKEKKALKTLVGEYDFFVANAKLMPSVAAAFGKVLGPAGKMPSPQLGIVVDESATSIKNLVEKISKSVKLRVKEPSIKVAIGNEGMNDEQLTDNIKAVYSALSNALPAKKENVKNVMVKLTMGKPIKVEGLQ
jgi:large subunit ribosomal protein L1